MPQACAAAGLALSVAIAGSFAFNDDVVPQPPALADAGGQIGERALHTPVLKLWEYTDELPARPVQDEDHWAAPQPAAAAASVRYFWGDEEILPAVASLPVDEAYWLAAPPELAQPVVRYFWFNDEITQAPTSSAFDDTGWGPQRKLNVPELKLWELADDLPQAVTPLGVVDDYWLPPHLAQPQPVVRHFWFNDEIAQAPSSAAFVESGWGPQRKLHAPELKLWEVADDLPQAATPLGVVDDYWIAPQPALLQPVLTRFWFNDEIKPVPDQQDSFLVAAIGADPLPRVFAFDEDIVPQPVALHIVEAEWQVYTPAWPAARPLYLPDPEQTLPRSLLVDEMYWQVYTPPLVAKVARVWYSEDEFGPFVVTPVYGWGARGRIGRTSAIDPWSRIGSEQAVDTNVAIGSGTATDPNSKIGSEDA